MLPQDAVGVVRTVVGLLAAGAYEELDTLTEGRRLSAPAMAGAVRRHGQELIMPPDAAFDVLAAAELGTGDDRERAYHVAMPLWTAREGRSTLEVQLILVEVMVGVWTVELVSLGSR
ncbi:hypothetical protein ACFVH6_40125 [Spirillospora sp. NPDC127200]